MKKRKDKIKSLLKVIKQTELPRPYDLSVAFVSSKKISGLNEKYRDKKGPTDILSFPLDKDTGQIIICEKEARKKAKIWKLDTENFICFLIIHGVLHLKGMRHGSKMEREESRLRKKFGV